MISPIYSSIHTENGRLDSAVRFLLFYSYCLWGSLHSAFLACTMRQIRVIGTALANDRRTQIIIIIQISLFFPSLLTALLQKGFPAGTVFVTALTIIGTGFLAWNHRETLLSNKKTAASHKQNSLQLSPVPKIGCLSFLFFQKGLAGHSIPGWTTAVCIW